MSQAEQSVQQAEREWQRLHPLSPVVRVARAAFAFIIVGLGDLARHGGGNVITLIIDGSLLAVVLAVSVVAWLVTKWRIEGRVLRIEGGLIRRTSRRFPAEQLQAVDIVNPAIARLFGLSEVRIRMAASTGTGGRLSYLPEAEAEALKSRLLALAHGVSEDTPPPPEQVLYTVPPGRLIASMILSAPGLIIAAVVVAIIVVAAAAPSALPGLIGAGASVFVVIVTTVARRLNGEYGLTLAEAPDGLRLRAGLVQTAAETIPRGRIQAVRMTQPLLWRPLGWCRVVVDVAGKQRSNRESQTVSGSLRAVLPVGSQDQAKWLLDRLIPGAPPPGPRPPRRVWIKSPLRYSNLSWNANAWYAVTTSGRVRRSTDWVPLSKVQSIRRMEGPIQRRMKVATVHLDTAGRNVHAIARDRDQQESKLIMDWLPGACRLARSAR